MNEKRRKSLREAIAHLERASSLVMDAGIAEQMAHDNLPDTLQYNERGERMEEVASTLEEAGGLIDEAIPLIQQTL